MSQQRYFAFISYNTKDTFWGKRLQKRLEHYRMPSTLCSEHGWNRKPMNPVFFAPTDIQPGGLSVELQERLKASRHLIVICSPNSAQSEWVGKEIEFFHNLGRTQNIHFFIVDGIPHSGNPVTECFNPIVEQLGLPEILGANIQEKVFRLPWLNRERAYVQLVSKLLGVEFDAIWKRHKRQLTRKVIAWTVGCIAVLCAIFLVWRLNQPFDVEIRLREASAHNDSLPLLKNAVVTMYIDNETKSDTICSLDTSLVFYNIPRGFMNKFVRVSVNCRDFNDVDTMVPLSSGITIDMYRDSTVYGDVVFTLWDWHTETAMINTSIQVDGINCVSDSCGRVNLFIPLERQKTNYKVTASFSLAQDVLTMPSSEGFAIVKE